MNSAIKLVVVSLLAATTATAAHAGGWGKGGGYGSQSYTSSNKQLLNV